MRYLPLLLCLLLTPPASDLQAQAPASPAQKVTPVVPYGGIYAIPEATATPDPALEYKLVIDVVSGTEDTDSLAAGLYNVARMLNLFSVGGVPDEHVTVVLAIHGGATFSVLNDAAYYKLFGAHNPNLPVIAAFKKAGVRVTVCGQSLLGRDIPLTDVAADVEVATSMLTTVAMYQMQGYGLLRF